MTKLTNLIQLGIAWTLMVACLIPISAAEKPEEKAAYIGQPVSLRVDSTDRTAGCPADPRHRPLCRWQRTRPDSSLYVEG